MKRFFALLIALCMVLALTACDSLPASLGGDDSDSSDVITAEEGYASGRIGDTMRSVFFDFTVNDAYLCGEYEGYIPSEGHTLLVLDMTVYNYTTASVPMFDTDFIVQWNSEEDDAFSVPVTTARDGYPNTGVEAMGDMLPEIYDVGINGTEQGLLVYEVAEGVTDFAVYYEEYFDDDTVGDLYVVYFTPEVRDAAV